MKKGFLKLILPFRRVKGGLVTGSNKENAKEININFNIKHLIFGIILLITVLFLLINRYISNPAIDDLDYYIVCDNESKELLTLNKTIFCGVNYEDLDYTIQEIINEKKTKLQRDIELYKQ